MLRRAAWLIAMTCLLVGCGGPPKARTTFLQSVDLIEMTDQMSQSFAADEVIGRRTADDQPWVISVYRVVNHTNQIITENEKWLYLARLRAKLAESRMAESRHLVWVIPPERWSIVAEELGVSEEPFGLRMDPTHLLTATFQALTITSGRGRSDAYLCDYQLVDLETGSIVWEDAWEVKRAVRGVTYD